MTIYTAMIKPGAEPVLVREGFSWGALLLGPLWLARHRAWIAAAIAFAVEVATGLSPSPASGILSVAVALILGLTGNDLRRWTLENKGYVLMHAVAARSADDAFVRLMSHRPDLHDRFALGAA